MILASGFYLGTGAAVESHLAHPSAIGTPTMSDQDFVYQFSLILLGDSGVGKSSVLHQFNKGYHSPDITTTIGVASYVKLIEIHGCRIKLEVSDTGGQDRFRAIVPMYYRNTVGGLLVFDITNSKSYANLSVWLEDAQSHHAGPYKPVFVLVGNKTDQARQRKVSKEEALSFANQHNMEYYETSAKNGSNIEKVFHKLTDKILTLVDDGSIKIEEGCRGVKRGTELSHTSLSGQSHHIGQRYRTPITLREPSDDDQERKWQKPRNKGRQGRSDDDPGGKPGEQRPQRPSDGDPEGRPRNKGGCC